MECCHPNSAGAREGERQGLEVVLGSEITTEYKGKEIHLLALFIKEEKTVELQFWGAVRGENGGYRVFC